MQSIYCAISLTFQFKDAILSMMSKVKVSDISEVTQFTIIVVMATKDRNIIPPDTLVSSKITILLRPGF